jgi:hypothetical protein
MQLKDERGTGRDEMEIPRRRASFPPSALLRHPQQMSIGFKEWALVCEALGIGAQSIILRKGGIAEGRAGFRFEHAQFHLFPTLFHEQVAKLKLSPDTAVPMPRDDDQVEIRYEAEVEWTEDIVDPEVLPRLAPFHVWRDEVIEERFRYSEKEGVSLAFVRVARLTPAFLFPNSPRFGGCRSWVKLPEVTSGIATQPVLGDAEHRERERQIRALLVR